MNIHLKKQGVWCVGHITRVISGQLGSMLVSLHLWCTSWRSADLSLSWSFVKVSEVRPRILWCCICIYMTHLEQQTQKTVAISELSIDTFQTFRSHCKRLLCRKLRALQHIANPLQSSNNAEIRRPISLLITVITTYCHWSAPPVALPVWWILRWHESQLPESDTLSGASAGADGYLKTHAHTL